MSKKQTDPSTPLVAVPASVPDVPPPVASPRAAADTGFAARDIPANHIAVPTGGAGGDPATHYTGMTAEQIAFGGGAAGQPPAYGSAAAPSMVSLNRVRVTFGLFLLFGFVFCLLLQFHAVMWILKWVVEREIESNCAIGDSEDDRYECMGAQGVYRVSFALFLFFLVHYIVSHRQNLCLTPEARVSFNQSYFLVKMVLLIVVILICFVIPNPFFVFFAWLSFVLSIFFLIAQLLVLIEFAYSWAEDWSARDDDRYTKGLLFCSVTMIIVAFVIVGLGFKWFGNNSDCGGNQAALSLTLIAGIFYMCLAIKVGRGTIVPASVVFIYTAWTCFSALSGSAEGPCRGVDTSSNTQLILSAVFTAASLVVSTLSAATSRDAFSMSDMEHTGAEGDAMLLSHFHGIMVLASAYLCMLVTNWTIVGDQSMASIYGSKNNASLGAKLGSEALCVVLFIVTLIAPMCCKSREF